MTRRRIAIAVVAAVAASSGLGCGEEKTFTAEEFVDEINAHGAAVALGPVITTSKEGVDVRSVTLTEAELSPTGAGGDNHGSGAVLVLDDSDQASAEMERCKSTLSLVCFRAANAVLRFEGLFPEEQARITRSVEALASD